jgi:hypothetical protein
MKAQEVVVVLRGFFALNSQFSHVLVVLKLEKL